MVMAVWILILIVLCLTTATGVYTLRQNGRNGHRNNNGNGHSVSQTIRESDLPSSEGTPEAGKKKIAVQIVTEESEKKEHTEVKHSSQPMDFPTEDSHDHPDTQHDPSPALREHRRRAVRSREDEEDEDEELSSAGASTPSTFVPELKTTVSVEDGMQEDWRHDDSVVDILIERKDGETQTTILQSDIGIGTHTDTKDGDAQHRPLQNDQGIDAKPDTQDIRIGDPVVTEEKAVENCRVSLNQSVQSQLAQQDESLQVQCHTWDVGIAAPSVRHQSTQSVIEQTDESLQAHCEQLMKSIQYNPLMEDKNIQDDVSIPLVKTHSSSVVHSEDEEEQVRFYPVKRTLSQPQSVDSEYSEDKRSKTPSVIYGSSISSHDSEETDPDCIKSEYVNRSQASKKDQIDSLALNRSQKSIRTQIHREEED